MACGVPCTARTILEAMLRISEHTEDGVYVVAVEGRIDSSTAGKLDAILPGRTAQHPALALDLAQVPYVSSAGLRVLLRAAKAAKQSAHRLALAGLSPSVREVLDISGFTGLFSIQPDLPSAIRLLG